MYMGVPLGYRAYNFIIYRYPALVSLTSLSWRSWVGISGSCHSQSRESVVTRGIAGKALFCAGYGPATLRERQIGREADVVNPCCADPLISIVRLSFIDSPGFTRLVEAPQNRSIRAADAAIATTTGRGSFS